MINDENTLARKISSLPELERACFSERKDFALVSKRHGAYLPHWTADLAVYHVTFRLYDALPQSVLETLEQERLDIFNSMKNSTGPLTKFEREKMLYLYSEKVDRYLDAGYGSCWLQNDEIARLIVGALEFFKNKRYQLYAWCVMPNHVHTVVQPGNNQNLSKILQSWKGYTSREANKVLGRSGQFWMPEYFDRIMRDDIELVKSIEYVYENPDKAGLRDWKWRWKLI